jgi:hypothetical protein
MAVNEREAKDVEVKLKAIGTIVEVLKSDLDMENKAKLLEWALENISAIVQGRVT